MGAAFVLVDGEHHPAAVREVLDRIEVERGVAAVIFCGGEEKVAPGVLDDPEPHYGRPVVSGVPPAETLRTLAASLDAEAVVDLADEPVLGPAQRLDLAALALHLGLGYEAPGLRLEPPPYAELDFAGPALAVIATGKRTGKTAVAGHWARLLAERGGDPVIVCMGRGGPAEPVVAEPGTGLDDLRAIVAAGGHAASDHLEGAVLAGVRTVGCRRVGGGLAGQPYESNVVAGARLGAGLGPSALILEGSGACIPPVRSDRTVCIVGGELAGLYRYRVLRGDLVLLAADAPLVDGAPTLRFALEPEPAEPVPEGARVALFTTGAGAPAGVEPVVASTNLSRRAALADDVDRAVAERCDLWLTELKAAAIDTVAARADEAGARVGFVRNRPVGIDGDLDTALLELADG
jgi:cyclic 2,3-diphosphoglycerate synthetase